MTIDPNEGCVPQLTLGNRLAIARHSAELTQEELALRIGVSRTTVRNYEAGRAGDGQRPTLIAWALATGVSLKWIEFGDAGVYAARDLNPQPADCRSPAA